MKFNSLWIAGLMLAATAGQVQAGLINGSFESPLIMSGTYINFPGALTSGGGPLLESTPRLAILHFKTALRSRPRLDSI